jgi:hypothetical protein
MAWSGNQGTLLKQELQTKLNEARVTQSAGYDAEVGVVTCATDAIGIAKLGMVKQVEELGPELQAEPAIGSESGLLKYSDVKIVDALQSKAGIHSCLIAEAPIWGRRKAGSVELSREVALPDLEVSHPGTTLGRRVPIPSAAEESGVEAL